MECKGIWELWLWSIQARMVDKMATSKGISFEGLISCVWEREQKDTVSVETSLDVNQLYLYLMWQQTR